jgi:hypothetical protein
VLRSAVAGRADGSALRPEPAERAEHIDAFDYTVNAGTSADPDPVLDAHLTVSRGPDMALADVLRVKQVDLGAVAVKPV